jgi:hypothetical protein
LQCKLGPGLSPLNSKKKVKKFYDDKDIIEYEIVTEKKQMSGLKINFEKSEIILIGGDNELAVRYAELFNCQIGFFPLRYLGVPIVAPSRLHVVDWAKMEEKSAKKLDVWQGNSLSIAGRTTLINSSLVNSTIYHMSMYLLPKTVIKRMDKSRRKFLWQGGSLKKKYHLVQWKKICRSKK